MRDNSLSVVERLYEARSRTTSEVAGAGEVDLGVSFTQHDLIKSLVTRKYVNKSDSAGIRMLFLPREPWPTECGRADAADVNRRVCSERGNETSEKISRIDNRPGHGGGGRRCRCTTNPTSLWLSKQHETVKQRCEHKQQWGIVWTGQSIDTDPCQTTIVAASPALHGNVQCIDGTCCGCGRIHPNQLVQCRRTSRKDPSNSAGLHCPRRPRSERSIPIGCKGVAADKS